MSFSSCSSSLWLRSLSRFLSSTFVVIVCAVLTACGGNDSANTPQAAPTGFTVTPTDSGAIVTWNQDASLDYWIFYAAASSITPLNYSQAPQSHVMKSVVSPLTITGLTNGTTYSFTMNSTKQGSPAGPATTSIAVVPRAAGFSWTAGAALTTANLNAVTVDVSALYTTVGAGGAIFTSSDLVTWTPRSAPTSTMGSYDLLGVVSGASSTDATSNASTGGTAHTLVAVGTNGTILTSPDAVSWSLAGSGSNKWNGVSYGNGLYVVVGDGGAISTSSDAVTWNAQTPVTGENLKAVTYGNGIYLVVGTNGLLMTSSDAATWTAQTTSTTQNLNAVAYGAATLTYVAVGDAGTIISSTDAASWTVQTPTSQNLYGVAAYSQFVVVGQGGTALYGLPSTAWNVASSGTTSTLFGLVNNNLFVAVGAAGANTVSR